MESPFLPSAVTTLMPPHELPEGVASLSRGAYFKEASLDMTLSILTESAVRMMGVERVGIWALTHDQEELRCLESFDRSTARHSSGGVLLASRCPAYFRALRSETCIAADDPRSHPFTAELDAVDLAGRQVSALLATPIHIRGELQGALCFEQVGTAQPWRPEHRLFAHAVANLVTLALVEFEAEQARQQAQAATDRLRAVFDASRDALLLADAESGLILDANRRAESLFARPRRELVGQHRRVLCPGGAADSQAMESIQQILRGDGSLQSVNCSVDATRLSDGRTLLLGAFRAV